MSKVKQFGNHLRDEIQWEDQAYMDEAFQMYADAINEAAHGWFPRSFRVWAAEFFGAMCIGGMFFGLIAFAISWVSR